MALIYIRRFYCSINVAERAPLRGGADFGPAVVENQHDDGDWIPVTRSTARTHRPHSALGGSIPSHNTVAVPTAQASTPSTVVRATNEMSREDYEALARRYQAMANDARSAAEISDTRVEQASHSAVLGDSGSLGDSLGNQGNIISGSNVAIATEKKDGSSVELLACRAIISSNAAYRLFENQEMCKLFDMIHAGTSDILPSGKSASGGLLDMCAKDAEAELNSIFNGREVGASTDGWKGQKRNSVNGVCGNVDFKAYPLQLVDATACAKDGPGMSKQFCEIIDFIEREYNCTVIYFVTDADGGSLKGRKLLQKLRPWLFTPSFWGHQSQLILVDYFKAWDYAQYIAERATAVIGWINLHSKVRVIFDDAQKELGAVVALAYLVAYADAYIHTIVPNFRHLPEPSAIQNLKKSPQKA
ncbi:hypothetical protein B0H10DRAFT_2213164 [Mycena sp. CBHHK59/15]|nr:hypothetical protein B0H10DRAFT_2213164 [Mycena sp. CBHHK59/15]